MASNIGHRVHFSVAHESQGVLSPRSGVNNSKASSLKQCNTEHRSRLTLDFEKLASPRIRLDLNIQHRVSPRGCHRAGVTAPVSPVARNVHHVRVDKGCQHCQDCQDSSSAPVVGSSLRPRVIFLRHALQIRRAT